MRRREVPFSLGRGEDSAQTGLSGPWVREGYMQHIQPLRTVGEGDMQHIQPSQDRGWRGNVAHTALSRPWVEEGYPYIPTPVQWWSYNPWVYRLPPAPGIHPWPLMDVQAGQHSGAAPRV